MSPDLYDSQSTTHTVDIGATESPGDAVVRAVSAISGLDPVPDPTGAEQALDPLYTVVDGDALDSLFRSDMDGTVSFTYHGYEVTVYSEGHLVVESSDAYSSH